MSDINFVGTGDVQSNDETNELFVNISLPKYEEGQTKIFNYYLGTAIMAYERILENIREILVNIFRHKGLKYDDLVYLLCHDSTASNLTLYFRGAFQLIYPDFYKNETKYFTTLIGLISECSNIRNSLVHSSFIYNIEGTPKDTIYSIAPSKKKIFKDGFKFVFPKSENSLTIPVCLTKEQFELIIDNFSKVNSDVSKISVTTRQTDSSMFLKDCLTTKELQNILESFDKVKRQN